MNAKIVIAVNASWNVWNFRSGLIRALVKENFDVVAVAPSDEYSDRLSSLGCRFISLPMDNKGTHPGRDLLLFGCFLKLLRREQPDVYLGFTVKPNVYGSMAAHTLGIPVMNNIAGLGTVFHKDGWLNHLVRGFYKAALFRSSKVFFQNDEDQQMFISGGLVAEAVSERLPGSGVDLSKYYPVPLPSGPCLRFLLIARMLWEKGVGEFIEAARMLKQRGVDAEFCLLGFLDVQNPGAIPSAKMDEWVSEGVVRYLGVSDKVQEEIARADCVVLPSFYREGTPRSLLEAAAMGRPIVTTDSVGCRDVVDHGINGYLCRSRDATDLAEKMAQVAAMSPGDREAMGMRGREKVESTFDEQIVINRYLLAIESILKRQASKESKADQKRLG